MRRFPPLLKWVGAVTAVLSLMFGIAQLWNGVFGFTSKRRHVNELLATGRVQLEQRDYRAAWASDSQAALLAGDEQRVRRAQEDVAMAWLAESHPTEDETPGIASRLTPVLQRGLVEAKGERKADILAHLGWAEFLRLGSRGGGRLQDSLYRQALAVDSENVYAHAMLGHCILWRRGSLDEARGHFAAALAHGRARGYVRSLQVAALANTRDEPAGDELVRVANDMRIHNDPLDDQTRSALGTVYHFRATSDTASLRRLLNAVPADEHLKTFQWLFGESGGDNVVNHYLLGLLQEAAGERDAALRTMQAVRREPSLSPRLRTGSAAAIRRLSRPL